MFLLYYIVLMIIDLYTLLNLVCYQDQFLWSDDQQFHQYQQNEQSSLILTHLTQKILHVTLKILYRLIWNCARNEYDIQEDLIDFDGVLLLDTIF